MIQETSLRTEALTLKSWRRPWKAGSSGYVDEAVIGSAKDSLTIGNINGIIQTGNYKEGSRLLLIGRSVSWLFHERHKNKTKTNSTTPITRENKERNTQPQQIQTPPSVTHSMVSTLIDRISWLSLPAIVRMQIFSNVPAAMQSKEFLLLFFLWKCRMFSTWRNYIFIAVTPKLSALGMKVWSSQR